MATIRSFFNGFISLVLLLSHLGCFIFSSTNDRPPLKKRKKAFVFTWSSVKRIISFKNPKKYENAYFTTSTLTSARSSQQSLVSLISPDSVIATPPRKRPIVFRHESDISLDHSSFPPLRNDIFPCPICGEIFQMTQLLEQHQSSKHAVSELFDGDSGKNIVQIIFKTGWNDTHKNLAIHRILKIHNRPKIVSTFEEYRESVKLKAAIRRRDERCIADGNELLRFHCTTFVCNLGQNGNSSVCNHQFCCVCGIIRCGFSVKMDGISTLSSSLRAHAAFPDEMEEEFAFMNLKRAMLVCRVVAGRIGCDQEVVDKDETGYDSVVGRGGGGDRACRLDEDELLVFNPRALLPCFVIVYSV